MGRAGGPRFRTSETTTRGVPSPANRVRLRPWGGSSAQPRSFVRRTSPMGDPRHRRISYRIQGSGTVQGAAAHWQGFSYQHGPWKTTYAGPWGSIQCWGSSTAEARRVIEHACAHAGIDPNDPEGTWHSHKVQGGRFQGGRRWKVAERDGVPLVTSRSGPDGPGVLADGSGYQGVRD